jgi:hypothetical protein
MGLRLSKLVLLRVRQLRPCRGVIEEKGFVAVAAADCPLNTYAVGCPGWSWWAQNDPNGWAGQ